MAVAVRPSKSILNIRSGIKSVKETFSGLKRETTSLNKVLLKKTKVKKESISRSYILFQKRNEEIRRKNREDVLEASTVRGAIKAQGKAVAASSKGFLGRIMDFLGTLLIGWLLTNLPTIIAMAQELIARMQKLSYILRDFFNSTLNLFRGFGRLITDVGNNIISIDFTDSKGRVENSLSDLQGTFDQMKTQFEDGFKLLSTPLDQGIASGENAPPTGTQYPNQTIPPTSAEDFKPGGSIPTQSALPKLPPVTLPGQNYGASREGGKRKHAGQDFDITGDEKFYSRIGGEVIFAGDAGGDYGNVVDIYNKELNVTERIAEALKILPDIKPGVIVKPGQAVVQGERTVPQGPGGSVGVIHYEIRKGRATASGSFEGTLDPIKFLNSNSAKVEKPEQAQAKPPQPSPSQPSQPQTTAVPSSPTTTATPSTTPRATSTPSGGTLSTEQLVAIAKQAGFNEKNAVIAAAVAKGESGGDSSTDTVKSGLDPQMKNEYSIGLWQINWLAHKDGTLKKMGVTNPDQLRDPLTNAKAAYLISGGSNFSPWSVYKSGKYKSFLPEAEKAAEVSPSQSQQTTTSTPAPAQIEPSGSQQNQQLPQQITPEKRGQDVVVMNQGMPQQSSSGGVISGGRGGVIPIVINPLNSFIKNKLLLDLAYT